MAAGALAHEDVLWRLNDVTLAGRSSPRLDRVMIDIREGVTAVLGESGAGKTSLLNVLVGFELPTRGSVTTSSFSLFWAPFDHGLWPHRTVRGHLLNGDESLLDAFGMRSAVDARPATLSAGERSRVAVMRAVSSGARVLVLDEPFANVDTVRQAVLWEALQDRIRANQQSVVLATHHPEIALGIAGHVICLADGRVLATGSPHELYHRPATREIAERFGCCNWLEPEDQSAWSLKVDAPCVRPERLVVEPAMNSEFAVEAVRFCGHYEEVRIVSHRSGRSRFFLHRPAVPRLRAGDTVRMYVIP